MRKPLCTLSNLSRKKSAQLSLGIADDHLSRIRGLMFRKKIIPILFIFDKEGIYPIHSNFVCAPFDAVYLSEEKKIVEIFRKIAPNTQLVTPKKKARYLVELPVALTDGLCVRVGDRIEWKIEEGKEKPKC